MYIKRTLQSGKTWAFQIDEADLPLLKDKIISRARMRAVTHVYVQDTPNQAKYGLHQLLLGTIGQGLKSQVEFIDGDGLNCCRANLRLREKQPHAPKQRLTGAGKTQYYGIIWIKALQKYSVSIWLDTKEIPLGTTKTLLEAVRLRNKKELYWKVDKAVLYDEPTAEPYAN